MCTSRVLMQRKPYRVDSQEMERPRAFSIAARAPYAGIRSETKHLYVTPRDILNYTPLEHLKVARPVDRVAHISAVCQKKRVLDLGALDETAYEQKTAGGAWLHEEIAKVADSVVGIDCSPAIPDGGLITAPNAAILRGDVQELGRVLAQSNFRPDVVVAGEFIEHLENPLDFLRSLRNIGVLKGATLLLSTPNATAIHNCLIALANRESTHPDHLCILSFKTLNTLLFRAGYEEWEIRPYFADFAEMKQRQSGIQKAIVTVGQMAVNLAERLFPLASFGLIVTAQI